jgi:hypothetical protein
VTHTRAYDDDEGEFSAEEKVSRRLCPVCKTPMTMRSWESSDGAFEDFRYTCPECANVVWIDGIDA